MSYVLAVLVGLVVGLLVALAQRKFREARRVDRAWANENIRAALQNGQCPVCRINRWGGDIGVPPVHWCPEADGLSREEIQALAETEAFRASRKDPSCN